MYVVSNVSDSQSHLAFNDALSFDPKKVLQTVNSNDSHWTVRSDLEHKQSKEGQFYNNKQAILNILTTAYLSKQRSVSKFGIS